MFIYKSGVELAVQLAFHTTDTVLAAAVAARSLLRFPVVFSARSVPGGASCAGAPFYVTNNQTNLNNS